jgi:hypothetical protein
MIKENVRGAAAVALLGASLATAQQTVPPMYPPPMLTQPSYPTTYYQTPTTGQVTPKNPLLLMLIVQPLLQQSGVSLAGGVGMLFSRLFNALTGHTANGANATMQNPMSAAGNMPGAAGYPQSIPQYGATYSPGGMYPQGIPTATPGAYSTPYVATAPPQYSPGTTYSPGAQNPANSGYAANPATVYQPPSTTVSPAYPGAAPTVSTSYPGVAPTGTSPPAPIAKSAVLPSVVYALNQLDPRSYTTIRQIELTHGAPMLHTGDVFAIAYSTNLPGQVRIDNVDDRGQITALGTYTVLPGHDNRIPVKKGIKLVGATGTETFKMYFFPCVADEAKVAAAAGAAAEGLSPCPAGPSPQLVQASKGLVVSKGAVNLDSPDPTIAVSAATNYQPNDVMENDFQLNHVAADSLATPIPAT